MASTASTPNPSPPVPSARVDELRGALASKGLVVKDSILARLAKSKSFKGLSLPEALTFTETLTQEVDPGLENLVQEADLGLETLAQDEESGFEKRLQALVAQKPKTEASEDVAYFPNSSVISSKDEKHDNMPSSSAEAEEGRVLAFSGAALGKSSEDERKQRRSERFGTVSEDEKLKMRAARFGTATDGKEEAEKKRARAARFGIVDEDAKKKARLERFSKDSEQENHVENEKRKARAARFAMQSEENLSMSKEN